MVELHLTPEQRALRSEQRDRQAYVDLQRVLEGWRCRHGYGIPTVFAKASEMLLLMATTTLGDPHAAVRFVLTGCVGGAHRLEIRGRHAPKDNGATAGAAPPNKAKEEEPTNPTTAPAVEAGEPVAASDAAPGAAAPGTTALADGSSSADNEGKA